MKKLIFIFSLVLFFNTSCTLKIRKSLKFLSNFVTWMAIKEVPDGELLEEIKNRYGRNYEKTRSLLSQEIDKVIRNNANPNRIIIAEEPLLNQVIRFDNKNDLQKLLNLSKTNPNISLSKEPPGTRFRSKSDIPLNVAISQGNIEFVQILLNHPHINPNQQGRNHTIPLCKAINEGKTGIVQILLNHPRTNPNQQDKHRNIPLCEAIRQGKIGIVQILLKHHRTNLNQQNKDGNTPLHKAILQKNGPIIHMLLNRPNIDVSRQDNDGNTPLHKAIYQGKAPIVQILLDHQADLLNQLNGDNRTPLHIAIRKGNPFIVLMFITRQADIYQQDNYGDTPLDLAAKLREEGNAARERIIKAIAIHSLFSAIEKADYEKIAQAMKYGAKINFQQQANGDTPMHVAVRLGNLEIVEYFLQFRPNLYIKNNNGENVLQLVTGHNNNQILKHIFLKSAFSCTEELPFEEISNDAISSDDIESFKWIIKKNPNINTDIKNELLLKAICQRSHNIIRFLLEGGANPNAVSENGDSCLHLAAHQGNKEIVEILLEHGADPHKTNVNDATSFEIAKKQDHNDIVISMLKHKKSSIFNRLFKSIITPFHLAGQKSMRILTKLGLSRGYTPIKFLIKCLHFWK